MIDTVKLLTPSDAGHLCARSPRKWEGYEAARKRMLGDVVSRAESAQMHDEPNPSRHSGAPPNVDSLRAGSSQGIHSCSFSGSIYTPLFNLRENAFEVSGSDDQGSLRMAATPFEYAPIEVDDEDIISLKTNALSRHA